MSYFLIITWLTSVGLQIHSVDFNTASSCYDAKAKIEASLKELGRPSPVLKMECVKK